MEEGLELEDGTMKIFLNMSSKNGSQELISLLQYMKDTRIDNPEILIKDSRILELDHIVQEVKSSEEWEGVRMNILEIGIEQGMNKKLVELVEKKLQKGLSVSEIADILEENLDTVQKIIDELRAK